MTQRSLFQIETRSGEEQPVGRESETYPEVVFPCVDEPLVPRLVAAARRVELGHDALVRARAAFDVRDAAEAIIEAAILEATRSGVTWREIGSRLGIPFQTLYRRYGAKR